MTKEYLVTGVVNEYGSLSDRGSTRRCVIHAVDIGEVFESASQLLGNCEITKIELQS